MNTDNRKRLGDFANPTCVYQWLVISLKSLRFTSSNRKNGYNFPLVMF